ncbi:MAG: hypothetical protein V3R25_10245 [Nitrosomonadaceae bacterium]
MKMIGQIILAMFAGAGLLVLLVGAVGYKQGAYTSTPQQGSFVCSEFSKVKACKND